MTLHLNKKHVLFQIESPQEVLKTYFLVTTKEKSKAELEQIFLERTERHFAKLVFSFRWDRPLLFGRFVRKSSKQLHTIQSDEDHVSEKIKSCFFLSIRYRKTAQTQDVKSQSTERSVQKKARPKRHSASEQKTRIVPSRETSGSSQNVFFSYNQRKKQSRAQADIFGKYSTSFWKLVFSFWWDCPIFFGRFVWKSSKQLHTIQNDEDHLSEKIKSCFFLSIRYRKTSQTQDVKIQSTERSVRKIAQPERDSAFAQKTLIVPSRETSGSSQNRFFIYNQSIQPRRAEKDISGTYTTSFWKVSVLLKKQKLFL